MTSISAVRFFKIITTTSLEDGKLRIPNSFTRKHGGDMSNPLFLKSPDGKEWNICWTKNDGDIWFQKGWNKFATHYSLDHGHMVLFEYEETSHFRVRIFDKSTLEIEYCIHGSQDEHNNLNQIRKESVEISDEQPSYKKTRPKSQISCPRLHKKLCTDTSDDVGGSSKLKNLPQLVQVKEEIDDTTECLKENQKQEQSTFKIDEALNKVRNFRSNDPSFAVVMKSSYVDQYLHVPIEFAKEYLKIKQSDILLEVLDGRTWPAKYSLGRIGVGWRKFVSDNNLKVWDICRFELTKSQTLTLKVLIFPLGEEPHYPPPQESVQGNEVNRLDCARIPIVESKTITSSKVAMRQEGRKLIDRNSLQTSRRRRCSFTNFEALEEAKRFTMTSKNPLFTIKLMTSNWMFYRPRVEKSFSNKYLSKTKQTVMLQFGEKMWRVTLLCFPYEPSSRLGGGWKQFVEENKLKAGDVCVFELINREDVVLDVHIFRGHS